VHRHHPARLERLDDVRGGPSADRRTAADGEQEQLRALEGGGLLGPQLALAEVAEVDNADAVEVEELPKGDQEVLARATAIIGRLAES
jgi:hypothetical protein